MKLLLTLSKVKEFEWSQDGRQFATVSIDEPRGSLSVWDSTKLLKLWEFPGIDGIVAWSPDGSRIAVPPRYLDPFRIVEIVKGRELSVIGNPLAITSIQWPIDREIFVASFDGLAKAIADSDGKYRFSRLPTVNIWDRFRISPDAKYIAVPHNNNVLEFWDLQNPSSPTVATFGTDVAWSPDSKFAAIYSDDRNVRVWNRTNGQISQLAGQRRKSDIVAWSANGALVGTADVNGNAVVFPSEALSSGVDELMVRAQSLLKRRLTSAECVQFFGSQTCPELRTSE